MTYCSPAQGAAMFSSVVYSYITHLLAYFSSKPVRREKHIQKHMMVKLCYIEGQARTRAQQKHTHTKFSNS